MSATRRPGGSVGRRRGFEYDGIVMRIGPSDTKAWTLAVVLAAAALLFAACEIEADPNFGNAWVLARYVEVDGTLDGLSVRSGGPYDAEFWERCRTEEGTMCLPVLILETINGNVVDLLVSRACLDSVRPGDPWPPSPSRSPCNE